MQLTLQAAASFAETKENAIKKKLCPYRSFHNSPL